MRIGIGIDTGGTCTDAVAYDYDTNTLLAKGKALTTKDDLTIGIGNALDKLPSDLIKKADIVALSTTLATNACVENKGCRAKLFIFGMGNEHLKSFNAEQYGLKREYIRGIDTHSSADGLFIDEPDWDELFEKYGSWMADADALTAAELYGTTSGAPCEKKLKKLVEEKLGIECVCANEINDKINVLARGATALLNSRLFPIIREFIHAAKTDFEERGCSAPITVVRSDGTLMSAELSKTRPVETILSGPSASINAGKAMNEKSNYLIIDMGGTTTDVSIVIDGRPVKAEGGIRIGSWRTLVSGVYVDTFALGGDTTIRYEKNGINLFTRKAMPICSAAVRWPNIKEDMEREFDRIMCMKNANYEFLYLEKEPANTDKYSERERIVLEALQSGPLMVGDFKEKAGITLYLPDTERLESEGIVMRCALTPTDFMHINNDYLEYDREASMIAAKCALHAWGLPYDEEAIGNMAAEAYDKIGLRMYSNLARIFLSRMYPKQFEADVSGQMAFMIDEMWKNRDNDSFRPADFSITTEMALVGVGAPTHVFLPEVAKAFGAECIIPEHAEVANAIGALKADIDVVVEIDVSLRLIGGAYIYIVHTLDGSITTDSLSQAYMLGKQTAEDAARAEAVRRGAPEAPMVRSYIKGREDEDNKEAIALGGTIVGEAIYREGI